MFTDGFVLILVECHLTGSYRIAMSATLKRRLFRIEILQNIAKLFGNKDQTLTSGNQV